MFTATLIADGTLNDAMVRDAAARIAVAAGRMTGIAWLDQGFAADIDFLWADDADQRRATALADTLTAVGDAIDVIVQPAHEREKALLVADMDSTMITVECIDELADYAGLKAEVAAITEAAMRGELDFEGALDARVALLKGLDAGVIDRCLAERVTIMPGACELVRTMAARGAHCVLVSGGFTRFAEPVAAQIGFARAIANVLELDGAVLAGTVARPIVGAATKLATLQAAVAAQGIDPAATLAVGDGANDLAMIGAAGLGVAYRAKPVVAAAAAARIDHNDLTALLYAQGIARADWVAG